MITELRERIDRAKAAVSIGDAWTRLGIPSPPPSGRNCVVCSPFRQDRKPSFSIFGGGKRFRDHAHSEHAGDAVDFVVIATGRSKAEAISTFLAMAGDTEPLKKKHTDVSFSGSSAPERSSASDSPSPSLSLAEVKPLTTDEGREIAYSRRLPTQACEFLGAVGQLVGTPDTEGAVVGWTLLDGPGWPAPSPGGPLLPPTAYVAETRRLDRQKFAHGGKSHTWRGSRKDWPVGVSALGWTGYRWRHVLAVEGGPDLLSAHALLAMVDVQDVLPISLLSREVRSLHPKAAELLKGHHVHIIPHNDPGSEHRHGRAAAERWAAQIFYQAGVKRVTV